MKRIALLLAILLVLTGLTACAEGPLDAFFEAGHAVLVETETAGFDLAACKIVMPSDEYWAGIGTPKPSEDEVNSMIAAALAEASVFSVSPAGVSALITVGGVNGTVLALNGDSLAVLFPSEARGVTDKYGNMRKLFTQGLRACLSDEGVVWSPDGRYAVIPNYRRTVINMQLIVDPMIIDTVTGEVFLTATYDDRIIPKEGEEPGGALTAACFSRDGRYLYYTFIGSLGQGRYSLLRCELATGSTELLLSSDDRIYYPRLSELRDGSFMILSDVREQSQPMGVARLTPGGFLSGLTSGGWRVSTASFDLPLSLWRVTQLDYSADSGWAFCLGSADSMGYALQRFRPDEGCAGIGQRWMLRTDTHGFIPLEGDTTAALSGMFSDGRMKPDAEYLMMMAAQLSPDGQYALVQYREEINGSITFPLLLVRLEDMKAVPVTGLSAELPPYRTPLTRKYAPGMEWNCGQILLMVDQDVRSYRFDTGN